MERHWRELGSVLGEALTGQNTVDLASRVIPILEFAGLQDFLALRQQDWCSFRRRKNGEALGVTRLSGVASFAGSDAHYRRSRQLPLLGKESKAPVAHDRIPVHRCTGLVLETQPKVIDDGGGVNV